MVNWIFSFFSDLIYWIAFAAMVAGPVLFALSKLVRLLPMLGAYALVMQIAGIGLTLGGGYYVSDHHGYARKAAEDQVEIDRLNDESRAKEDKSAKKIAGLQNDLKKVKNDNNSKKAVTDTRIDNGELHVPGSCAVQASSNPTDGSAADSGERERAFLKAANDLTVEADNAIEERNTCIRQYNEIRDTYNEATP